MGDRLVRVLDAGDALGDAVDGLPPQGALQAVGEMAGDLLEEADRLLSDMLVEGDRPLDGGLVGCLAADDLDQRDEVRGLNGWPTTSRPGWVIRDCRLDGVKPEVEEAMMRSGATTASIRASSSCFSASRSGACSCTKSAPRTHASTSVVKVRRSGSAPAARPRRSSVGQARRMKPRAKASPSGAGSVAQTS